MKLHHTVFLLVFIALAVFSVTVTYLCLNSSLESALYERMSDAALKHTIFSDDVVFAINERQLEKGGFLLLGDDIRSVISAVEKPDFPFMAEFDGNIFASGVTADDKALEIMYGASSFSITSGVYKEGETLFACHKLDIAHRSISILSLHSVKSVFSDHKATLRLCTLLCLAFSVTVSSVVSLSVKLKTKRLKKINGALRSVSGGNYIVKAEPKGCYEIRQLAENVNLMTDSVNAQAEKLKDISESRKRFVDNMAHEMKTPLTSIMCMADILRIKRNVKEKELRESANVIFEEAKRMKALSSKLLSLAETDSTAITKEIVNAFTLLDDIKQAITPLADAAGVRLSFYSENVFIFVDIQLFKTMIFNLIDNAVKASESGGSVEVHCFAENKKVKIVVADHGIGMSEVDLKHATEPFYRADKARSRKKGGVGLGLSLCVSIAKRHNAVFNIKSEKGVGTVVSIETEECDGAVTVEEYE